MSHWNQIDIIAIIGSVISNTVLKHVKETKCFYILTEETMDISGWIAIYLFNMYIVWK